MADGQVRRRFWESAAPVGDGRTARASWRPPRRSGRLAAVGLGAGGLVEGVSEPAGIGVAGLFRERALGDQRLESFLVGVAVKREIHRFALE